MKPASPSSTSPSLSRQRLWALALVLLFLLLAWGVWWYFDYKIRSLDAALAP